MQLNQTAPTPSTTTLTPDLHVGPMTPNRRRLKYLGHAFLVAIWIFVLAGIPGALPFELPIWPDVSNPILLQIASWLTFLALFITPGYLLADMLTWRLELDWIERLALAFPLGVAVMAVPGMAALLLHMTLLDLTVGWVVVSGLVIIAWLVHWTRRRDLTSATISWTTDERLLLVLLVAAFALALPTLNYYKIDGDAYAVGTFAADALAGLPLNASEPLFGTTIGPGVRMAFNQSLPMAYLWSYLSHIDPITLTAAASRSMVALWVLLAAYTLGKAAGVTTFGAAHGRRFGLFLAALQMLIFLASPFVRGDNVSLFFFERTTADKFMVPATMLPIAFALVIRYLAGGRGGIWWTAALVTFAVSTIHPLIAAMMAMALTAFAVLHWLLNWRSKVVFFRCLALAGLVIVAMALPILQLVLARGEAPLAASYPTSIEGWPVGTKQVAALPFFYLPTLEIVGPLPDLTQLEAEDANTVDNPFLIWRFAVNMNRRRLLLFDLDHYISDPNIMLEPPYLLALLLLPVLLWKIRRSLAAQFAVGTTLAILFVMFNPWITPVIGDLVMPWILWRFVWMLPYTLILALVSFTLLLRLTRPSKPPPWGLAWGARWAPLALIVSASLALGPLIGQNLQTLAYRATLTADFPAPQRIFAHLQTLTAGRPATVLADQNLSVTLPAYVAQANIVAHRMPTTSEIFPADQQADALQRLIDQARFYRARYLTAETLDVLGRYQAGYLIATSGSDLDIQLRAAPQWFTWELDDQGYSLYTIHQQPQLTPAINGNTALAQRLWVAAENFYTEEQKQNPDSALAVLGLAELARVQGQFTRAIDTLQGAIEQTDQPIFHYRLGQIYAELGQFEQSIAELSRAQSAMPTVPRIQLALSDVCLSAGDVDCAAEHLAATLDGRTFADEAGRNIALADLWRQRGQTERALTLYAQAVAHQPGEDNQLMLASVYQETGRLDEAAAQLEQVRTAHPLSTEALIIAAGVKAGQAKPEEALALYRRAIWLQDLQGIDSAPTQLAQAQLLLDTGRATEAQAVIEQVLSHQPNNASAHSLLGDLYLQQDNPTASIEAYQTAFRLDPTRVGAYLALSNQLREEGGFNEEMAALLERAIKASPDEPMLALALGDQQQRQGESQAATDAYQAALNLLEVNSLPNTRNARGQAVSRAYAYTRLAGVSEEMGVVEPALNYYAAAAAAAPTLSWPQVLWGDALRRQGNLSAAEAAYTRAIERDATSVDAYMRLAELAGARGDEEQVAAYQQQALEIALASAPPLPDPADRSSNSSAQPTASDSSALQTTLTDATLQSDETLAADSKGRVAANTDTINQQIVERLRASAATDPDPASGNRLGLLAHLYQLSGQNDQAHALYTQLIAEGELYGWPPATLAGYHKGIGDLELAQNEPTAAVEAYQAAIRLDEAAPQPRLGLARALADLGRGEDAIEQLRAAVNAAPGYVDAQVALASALDQQGSHDEALAIYESTAATHPGNARATLALAHAWQGRGQWDNAEQSYRATIITNPGSADAYVGLASTLLDRGRYTETQALLDKALTLDQQNVNAYIQAGILAQRQGDAKMALTWFDKATELRLGDPSISITLIDLLRRTGNYETAVTYLNERLAEQPADLDLLLRLAALQRLRGRYSEALTALLTAERSHSADGRPESRIVAELGELYLAQGKPRAALGIYRSAINGQPSEATYYQKAAELWQIQANLKEATATLKTGIARAAAPSVLYAALARLELQQGNWENAESILQQAMPIVGETTDLVAAMGEVLTEKSEDEAEAWYHTVLERQPRVAAIHVALANFYLRTGKTESALASIRQALELEPANASTYVMLGNALELAQQSEDAVAAYRQAIALEPTLVDGYTALAALYQTQEKWEEAQAVFTQALEIAPADGVLRIDYGAFLLKRNQEEDALAVLASADQLAPTSAMLVARAAVYQSIDRPDDARRDLELAFQEQAGSLDVLLALGDLYRTTGESAKAQQMHERAVQLNVALKKEE